MPRTLPSPGTPTDLPDPRDVEDPDDDGLTPSERRRELLEAGRNGGDDDDD